MCLEECSTHINRGIINLYIFDIFLNACNPIIKISSMQNEASCWQAVGLCVWSTHRNLLQAVARIFFGHGTIFYSVFFCES